MTQLVIDHVHPDYLTLLSEPDTFAGLTGYTQASTPAGAMAMLETVTAGVQRGTTKIGAGSGSWLANSVAYAQTFAASPALDYVSVHIYPTNDASLDNAQGEVDAARAAGKPVVLDEAWLYKVAPGEPPPRDFDAVSQIFLRDNYSFWAPLDERFLALLGEFVRVNRIAYVAPFWTTFFWAYVDYGPATQNLDLSADHADGEPVRAAGDAERHLHDDGRRLADGRIAAGCGRRRRSRRQRQLPGRGEPRPAQLGRRDRQRQRHRTARHDGARAATRAAMPARPTATSTTTGCLDGEDTEPLTGGGSVRRAHNV